MRRNASPDDPNLAALAKLSDISLTRKPDTDSVVEEYNQEYYRQNDNENYCKFHIK